MKTSSLKAPYPYVGGKSAVAQLVWDRLGNPDNYCEPFAGSLAALLKRPPDHFRTGYKYETVGDLNHHIVNFWRAVKEDPDAVAKYADSPVMEADLHARHVWLARGATSEKFRKRIVEDADYFDPKFAGWWVWGQCCWIGGGWCNDVRTDYKQLPMLETGGIGNGVHSNGDLGEGRPQLADAFDIGRGVNAGGNLSLQIPELATGNPGNSKGGPRFGGRGVRGTGPLSQQIPELAANFDIGRGVTGGATGRSPLGGAVEWKQVFSRDDRGVNTQPDTFIQQAGICEARNAWLRAWMKQLADRLRLVRTCYGHWSRICDSESTLTRLGTTAAFLDPPYPVKNGKTGKASRSGTLYANDKSQDLNELRDEVLAWCKRWGPKGIRIAVCGYSEDGYEDLEENHGWDSVAWKTAGGYGNQSKKKKKNDNAARERIFFSPACLKPNTIFDLIPEDDE